MLPKEINDFILYSPRTNLAVQYLAKYADQLSALCSGEGNFHSQTYNNAFYTAVPKEEGKRKRRTNIVGIRKDNQPQQIIHDYSTPINVAFTFAGLVADLGFAAAEPESHTEVKNWGRASIRYFFPTFSRAIPNAQFDLLANEYMASVMRGIGLTELSFDRFQIGGSQKPNPGAEILKQGLSVVILSNDLVQKGIADSRRYHPVALEEYNMDVIVALIRANKELNG